MGVYIAPVVDIEAAGIIVSPTAQLRISHRPVDILVALLGIAGVVVGVFEMRQRASSAPAESTLHIVDYLGSSPLRVAAGQTAVRIPYSHDDLQRIAKKLVAAAAADRPSPSALLHTSRLAPLVGSAVTSWMERDFAERVTCLRLQDVFQDTWRGLETRQSQDGERIEHRDQLLSALADFGVALTCKLECGSATSADAARTRTVRDLLRTSIDEFHLHQAEMSWTVMAYVLYMPPQLHWQNRYGEQFDFDDVAEALITKPLKSESCGGIHLMCAATTMLRIDADERLLQPAVGERLRDFVALRVQEAEKSQLPDGSWPSMWSSDSGEGPVAATAMASIRQRLMITGHLLEWFDLLPAEIQPPDSTVRSALLWIVPTLQSLTPEELAADICPCTHALLAASRVAPHVSGEASASP